MIDQWCISCPWSEFTPYNALRMSQIHGRFISTCHVSTFALIPSVNSFCRLPIPYNMNNSKTVPFGISFNRDWRDVKFLTEEQRDNFHNFNFLKQILHSVFLKNRNSVSFVL